MVTTLLVGFLMTQPESIVLETPSKLDSKLWNARQGTRWSVEVGVLKGLPSTSEYQANHKDHKGLEPRLALPTTPQDFAAEFDLQFSGGSFSKLAPFIEYGHHKARFSFSNDALTLDADSGKAQLGSSKGTKYKSEHWYHVIAEQRGEEALIQVDGVRLFGTHPSLNEKTEKGAAGLGFCGTRGGTLLLKNLKVWAIKPDASPSWLATKAELTKPKG